MDKMMLISEYARRMIAPPGEVIVIALALIIDMLFKQSNIYKNKSLSYIIKIIRLLYFASITRLCQFVAMTDFSQMHFLIYTLRFFYYICICGCFYMESIYLREPLRLRTEVRVPFDISAAILLVIAIITDIVLTLTHVGFYLHENMAHVVAGNPYIAFCLIMCGGIYFDIIFASARITRKTAVGLLMSFLLPFALIFMQNFFENQYYMTFATFIPVIALILLFHTGAYNKLSGTAGTNVFYNQLDNFLNNGKTCYIYMGYIRNFSNMLKHSKEFQNSYQKFYHEAVRDGMIFMLDSNHVVMLFEKKRLSFADVENAIEKSFYDNFGNHNIDYKVLSVETSPRITEGRDYGRLLSFVEERLANCSAYRLTEKDYEEFAKNDFIYNELCDIYSKKDINDPRVLVYCQPVYNVQTGTYDTAEALMRLKIHKYGVIYPDQFIPIAEKHDIIHTLTLILLNKTSKQIAYMLRNGYNISRISVNFSVKDMEKESLSKEITEIIKNNGLNPEKIAAEITESKIIKSLDSIKPHIMYFHEHGMKLYLDDFGTGYSNFERIMELPFDIIKFDRSLVIESKKNQRNYFMIKSFAEMFNSLEYKILFEGIEDDSDEQRCVNMRASYLQGYKYSKPIPLENWTSFLAKRQ